MKVYVSRQNKGFAVPAALGILVILMVLGTTLWHVGMADGLQTHRMEWKVQASYLARSGIAAMSDYLVGHYPGNPGVIDDLLDVKSDPVTLGNGTFVVELYENPDGLLVLESVGTVRGVSHTARMSLNETGVPGSVAMYGNRIDINGQPMIRNNHPSDDADSIVGPVIYGDGGLHGGGGDPLERFTDPDGVDYDGDIVWPDPLPAGEIEEENDHYPTRFTGGLIEENTRYGSVRLAGGNSSLDVRLGDGETSKNVYLVVDEFNGRTGTSLNVSGPGVFYIYVEDSFSMAGNISSDNNWSDNHIVIVMAGEGTINMTGTSDFAGIVYAPNADLTLGGTNLFTGQVIADTVTIQGTGSNTYAFEYYRLPTDSEGLPLMLKKGKWLQ